MPNIVLPFQPEAMSPAQLAAVSYLARYSGHTHALYAYQLRRWFGWCETIGLDPLVGIQRAHVELYIRHLGLRPDAVVGDHLHACGARVLPLRPHRRTDPERSRRLRTAAEGPLRRVSHPGARPAGADPIPTGRPDHHRPPRRPRLLLGTNALRASEAAAVRIEDYQETMRGHRVLHLIGKGTKPATMPLTVPVLRVLEACRGQRATGPLILRPVSAKPIDRRDVYRMVVRIAAVAAIPRHISPHSLRHAAITNALDAGVPAARRPNPGSTR